MTDYVRIRTTIESSSASDYSNAETHGYTLALTPDEWFHRRIEADTGGTTVAISTYASMTGVFAYNRDSTNYVTVNFATAAIASVTIRLDAGEFFFSPDILPTTAITLTANTAAVVVDLYTAGT